MHVIENEYELIMNGISRRSILESFSAKYVWYSESNYKSFHRLIALKDTNEFKGKEYEILIFKNKVIVMRLSYLSNDKNLTLCDYK